MANGLQMFNLNKLGFIPWECWGECEMEPQIRGKYTAPDSSRGGYLNEKRQEAAITPEDEMIAAEQADLDPDMIALHDTEGLGLEFPLGAACNMVTELGYHKDHVTHELGLVVGHYLAQDHLGVRGMDGVIELLLHNRSRDPKVDAAVLEFTGKLIDKLEAIGGYRAYPEVTKPPLESLIKAAKKGNRTAAKLGFLLFGASFNSWLIKK